MQPIPAPVPERAVDSALSFAGVPLSVVYAESDSIEAARSGSSTAIALVPPFHVSDEDVYLVLPDDIGTEIVDILRDGDLDLLHEAMRDGLLVHGAIESVRKGEVALHVERALTPVKALASLPYAAEVSIGGARPDADDPIDVLNDLDHLRCMIASDFVDEEGLEMILREPEHCGVSWRAPQDAPAHLQGEPTHVWSTHLLDGRIGIELALFTEYEELVVVLRPVVLEPG